MPHWKPGSKCWYNTTVPCTISTWYTQQWLFFLSGPRSCLGLCIYRIWFSSLFQFLPSERSPQLSPIVCALDSVNGYRPSIAQDVRMSDLSSWPGSVTAFWVQGHKSDAVSHPGHPLRRADTNPSCHGWRYPGAPGHVAVCQVCSYEIYCFSLWNWLGFCWKVSQSSANILFLIKSSPNSIHWQPRLTKPPLWQLPSGASYSPYSSPFISWLLAFRKIFLFSVSLSLLSFLPLFCRRVLSDS